MKVLRVNNKIESTTLEKWKGQIDILVLSKGANVTRFANDSSNVITIIDSSINLYGMKSPKLFHNCTKDGAYSLKW